MRAAGFARPAAVLLSIAALPFSPAHGWGREGHQAVCEIAFLELGPGAREAVKRLIRADDRYRTFRAACTWADTGGRVQDERRPEHYVNVPRHWATMRGETCPLAPRCLFTALRRDAGVLGSPRSSAEERVLALRSLGHWVADVHQPLHVSFLDDRGGTRIPLQVDRDCADDLHGYWDRCLPRDLMRRLGARSPRVLGEALRARITPDLREAWLRAGGAARWAEESLAIVREADTGYCRVRDGECRPRTVRAVAIDRAHRERHLETVATRLQQAGVRLAALLEELLEER